MDWPAFFSGAALPATMDRLSVAQPSYQKALAKLVASTPVADWQLYLRARLLESSAPVLPKAFREAHFDLHGKTLSGQQSPKPRWEQAIKSLDGALGEAVGQVYAARFFPPENKARMQALVGNLMAAYRQSINDLAWMSEKTKARAQEKLSKYMVKIGYPDRWRDYSALEVRAGDPVGNGARAGRFEYERHAKKLGQPVDRSEWGMTPQTVNAYYNPSFNEIVWDKHQITINAIAWTGERFECGQSWKLPRRQDTRHAETAPDPAVPGVKEKAAVSLALWRRHWRLTDQRKRSDWTLRALSAERVSRPQSSSAVCKRQLDPRGRHGGPVR
eukprot:gene45561-60892_t